MGGILRMGFDRRALAGVEEEHFYPFLFLPGMSLLFFLYLFFFPNFATPRSGCSFYFPFFIASQRRLRARLTH